MKIWTQGTQSPSYLNFVIIGDGENNSLTTDLAKAPFNLEFNANFPVGTEQGVYGATVTFDGSLMTVTTDHAMDEGEELGLQATPVYNPTA